MKPTFRYRAYMAVCGGAYTLAAVARAMKKPREVASKALYGCVRLGVIVRTDDDSNLRRRTFKAVADGLMQPDRRGPVRPTERWQRPAPVPDPRAFGRGKITLEKCWPAAFSGNSRT